MAERKAVNKYYPPDWDPSKGSINAYNKSHPLRSRAKKIDKGILVVRFGMPFNIWCSGCENHIGMGVRYNAEKSKVGSYYTSPIYQFDMKCHLCDNHFIIETDPANFDYVIKKGGRRQLRMAAKEDEDDTAQITVDTEEERKRRTMDAMYSLEKEVEDKMKVEPKQINLREIKKWRERRKDSFSLNQLVRAQYRQRRKRLEQAKAIDKNLRKKASLKISLVKPEPSDVVQARQMVSAMDAEKLKMTESTKKAAILNSSQFIPRCPRKTKNYSPVVGTSGRQARIKKEF